MRLKPLIPPVATAVSLAVATGGVMLLKPETTHVQTCLLNEATGWFCPVCGGMRAVQALASGRLADAWHYNQLFVIFVPLIAWAWVDWTRRAAKGEKYPPVPDWIAWGIFGVWMAFGVVRNLPGFEFLTPPN